MRNIVGVLVIWALMVGCSSASSKGNHDNGNANDRAPNVVTNSGRFELCGDPERCDDSVDCRLCRYEREVLPIGRSPSVALGESLGIVYIEEGVDDAVRFAYRGTSGEWESELVEGGLSLRWTHPRIAMADDGTPWVAYWSLDDLTLRVATRVGGTWNSEAFESVGGRTGITTDAEGVPWIAYSDLISGEVILAGRTDGEWTTTPIDTIATNSVAFMADLAVHEGSITVAWLGPEEEAVNVGWWDGAEFTSEVAVDGVSRTVATGIDLAASADGTQLALAVGHSAYRRENEAWSEPLIGLSRHMRNPAVWVDGDGLIRLAGAGSIGGLRVGEAAEGVETAQTIVSRCDEDAVLDTFVAPNGTYAVLADCETEVALYSRVDVYPEDYPSQCESLASASCEAAIECNPDTDPSSADLCLYRGTSAHCTSEFGCEQQFGLELCGDATQQASVVSDCLGVVDAGECRVEGEDGGIVLPSGCPGTE